MYKPYYRLFKNFYYSNNMENFKKKCMNTKQLMLLLLETSEAINNFEDTFLEKSPIVRYENLKITIFYHIAQALISGFKRGRIVSRARNAVVRLFEAICNCTNSGPQIPIQRPATEPKPVLSN